jgi:hypothetical protein
MEDDELFIKRPVGPDQGEQLTESLMEQIKMIKNES